ncbi:type IV secretory system conjugative DNA transfer family protein [bacterium]|nr:type IV secretory system conjugative DNA transfer family protein [bacterium]
MSVAPLNTRNVPIEHMAGNQRVKYLLLNERRRPLNEMQSVLIEGPPGTGKSSAIRDQLAAIKTRAIDIDPSQRLYCGGDPAHVIELSGANISAKTIEHIDELLCPYQLPYPEHPYHHNIVFIDELGELFHRGLGDSFAKRIEKFERLFWFGKVLLFGTAQSFTPRSSKTVLGRDSVFERFLLRFIRVPTEKPTESEMIQFISKWIGQWGLRLESIDVAIALADKANGAMGLVVNCFDTCSAHGERVLTIDGVNRFFEKMTI